MFSTGCHAGYNVVDADGISGVTQTADWAQVLASKGATLVAGTGFQYGDDELIEYSERIYAEFAHQLRVGTGPVSVGNALVQSKLAYLSGHARDQGHAREGPPDRERLRPADVLDQHGRHPRHDRRRRLAGHDRTTTLGVTSGDLALTNTDFQVPAAPVPGPNGTTYFTGRDGVASNPGEPALPRYVANVDVPNKVLRGVGFRSGDVHRDRRASSRSSARPARSSVAPRPHSPRPTFYPARMWAASYFAELSGGADEPRRDPGPASRRRPSAIRPRSAGSTRASVCGCSTPTRTTRDAALATAPAISDVGASLAGSTVTFSARVHGTDAPGR